LAIYIDIIARLNQQRLYKQGEDLRKYINGLEDEIRDHRVRAARGETRQLVKLEDAVATSRDQVINKTDDLINAYARLTKAQKLVADLNKREETDEKKKKELREARIAAAQEEADAKQNLVYKLQAENKASRANELAKRTLNEETKAHAKNLRDVAKITDKNQGKFIRLSMATNKLRRDLENLHAANIVYVQDNKSIAKSMEGLSDATKKVATERDKYKDVLLTKNPARIKAQGLVVQNALEAEGRKARDLSAAIVDLVRQQRDHDSVIQRNEKSLRGLADQSLNLEMQTKRLRYVNQDAVDQNRNLARQFDRVDDSVQKVSEELQKYHQMSQDASVSSEALAIQIGKINKAFLAQQRVAKDSESALDDYYKRQADAAKRAEEAIQRSEERKRAQEARDRAKLKPQSAGQYIARNIGALTPLGTLSPSAILPVAAIMATVAEAAVTASQSIALLPAAGYAAAAGITTLTVGMWGFGDALSSMDDPKKFAEALFNLSPNAQQAALSLKNLVDGPLGDLKRSTQDALFANVSPTLQKLTATLGPTLQRMMTSIAGSFNKMFTGISFQFMSPEGQRQINTITANIASMFERIGPGVLALTSAFAKIAETGSSFLPGLADGFTGLMQSFDNFITRAQQDGSLANFIQKGIDAVKVLSKFLFALGQDIYKVFGNKSAEEFMVTLNKVKDVAVWLFNVFEAIADGLAAVIPFLDAVIGGTIGWENAVRLLGTAWGVVKLGQIVKWMRDVKAILPGLIAESRILSAVFGSMGGTAAAGIAAGGAAAASAAKNVGKNTAATFAAAGTNAGKGFSSKLISVIKGAGWIGLGIGIAEAINKGIRSFKSSDNSQGTNDTIDAIANGFDMGKMLNPAYWLDKILNGGRGYPSNQSSLDILTGESPPATPGTDGNFYKDWYPAGENPAMPSWPDMPGYDPSFEFTPPNVLLDENGKALTDTEILNKLRGELPKDSYTVDPFTDPITGQKLKPMLPMGPNGMPQYPAGGVPGTPSIKGPIMPQYNSFGQLTGYGANMVDPEAVFDAQLAVTDKARDLEEANKDLLAARQSGLMSEEEIHDLERKVLDQKLGLHKALSALGKAQTGDVEKLKTETDKARDALGDFGAEIDKDFGISKGLPGIAENITKFLANMALAPVFGAIRGAQAGLGFPQGEGAGSGLTGMIASSMGYYKGGPLDPNPPQGGQNQRFAPGYEGYTPSYLQLDSSTPGGPLPVMPQGGDAYQSTRRPNLGGVGYGSGPGDPKSRLRGINLSTIPVAAQQYANNCIDAAAQIILSASGVSLSQDQIEKTIARGGSISSLAAGLNRLNPNGGYVAMEGSGGSPEALLSAVQNSINRGLGSVLNVAPGSSIAGRNFPAGHFIAVTGYDPQTGRVNLSDTADGSMYSVSAAEAFAASRGRGLVSGTGFPQSARQQPSRSSGPVYGPPLPKYATGGEVPIMAHSGEHVLTRDDVNAMGGQAAVYNFRRSLHRYENGGEPVRPTNLGELLGVGDSPPPPAPPPPPPPPKPPKAPAPPASSAPSASTPPAPQGPPLAAEAPDVPVPPAVPGVSDPAQLPQTALPGGVETPGTVIGAQVEAPQGYGGGLSVGGGLVGLAQGAAMSAVQMAGMAGDAAGAMGGGSAGAAVASAAMQIGFEELNRAIEYAGQVASIAGQGMLETFLPAGGSELAQNNWATRFLGGIAGAAPTIANLAGGAGASNQSTLAGVGGPPTPEQIAAQGMDPNRSQHTGAGAPAGPYTGVNIENYVVAQNEDRAGQDLARYQPAPGAR
jgi:hypothetical protein